MNYLNVILSLWTRTALFFNRPTWHKCLSHLLSFESKAFLKSSVNTFTVRLSNRGVNGGEQKLSETEKLSVLQVSHIQSGWIFKNRFTWEKTGLRSIRCLMLQQVVMIPVRNMCHGNKNNSTLIKYLNVNEKERKNTLIDFFNTATCFYEGHSVFIFSIQHQTTVTNNHNILDKKMTQNEI